MKKTIFSIFNISHAYMLISSSYAYTLCPLCTVAVGAGVGLSKKLGIDDTITGLWIGGLMLHR